MQGLTVSRRVDCHGTQPEFTGSADDATAISPRLATRSLCMGLHTKNTVTWRRDGLFHRHGDG
jgi:hypothetical protein